MDIGTIVVWSETLKILVHEEVIYGHAARFPTLTPRNMVNPARRKSLPALFFSSQRLVCSISSPLIFITGVVDTDVNGRSSSCTPPQFHSIKEEWWELMGDTFADTMPAESQLKMFVLCMLPVCFISFDIAMQKKIASAYRLRANQSTILTMAWNQSATARTTLWASVKKKLRLLHSETPWHFPHRPTVAEGHKKSWRNGPRWCENTPKFQQEREKFKQAENHGNQDGSSRAFAILGSSQSDHEVALYCSYGAEHVRWNWWPNQQRACLEEVTSSSRKLLLAGRDTLSVWR